MRSSLLIVEVNSRLRDRWAESFRKSGHNVFALSCPKAAIDVALERRFDLAVLSFDDPEASMELKTVLKKTNPSCQITIVSERPAEERDALVMEAGARSLLLKPFDDSVLEQLVERATSSRRKKTEGGPDGDALSRILGESDAIQAARELIAKIAAVADTSVLIRGESGTGKELAARAVHGLSPRSGGPFLELNCAAIPENLLESELFGYERGAFTSADRSKPGLFELANGGTVFLDEIGEMNLELQAKLLRVLDTRMVRRLGGSEPVGLNVRILTATNRDLAGEVDERRFRADLFHRLNVVQIEMPPLRERKGDIALLAAHFLGLYRRKFGKGDIEFGPGVVEGLQEYHWPGNVRELMNQVERVVLVSGAAILTLQDFGLITAGLDTSLVEIGSNAIKVDFSRGPVPIEQVERELILQALESARWNVTEAARLLGIGRGALRYKIEAYDLRKRALAG